MIHSTAVAIDGLGVRYGAIQAVDDVALELPEGQLLALLGPNGAGKTTLLSALLGLLRPDAGQVQIFGHRPGSLQARCLTGVMLQTSGVPELLSAAELIDQFRSFHVNPMARQSVIELAGIELLANRRFSTLSGGQKQQVLFALAIVGRPRLLLLDEPSNGMDINARARLWRTVQAMRDEGCAVLLTTHYIEEADRLADQVILLDRGRVLAKGSPTQIKSRLSGSEIRFHTRLNPEQLREIIGQAPVEVSGGRCRLTSTQPEKILTELLQADPQLQHLEVRPISLEDALSSLTLENAA